MRRLARGYLIVVSVLNGLAGLICGVLLLVRPDGALLQAGALLPVIGSLPLASVFFRDFTWIGLAMLLVLGIPNTVAAVLLVRRASHQYIAALVSALLLMAWTAFELVFMYNVAALGYFAVGTLSLIAVLVLRHR